MATIKREENRIYIQTQSGKMALVGEVVEIPAPVTKKILTTHRDFQKHLFKVWNSYGFAKEVIDHADWFDLVLLSETKGQKEFEYLIPRTDIILHGREYESESFERQYFITRERLKHYKT